VTPKKCLDLVASMRREGFDLPVIGMTYANLLFKDTFASTAKKWAAAGMDGAIVPDISLEDAAPFRKAWKAAGLATTFFVAPSTSDGRVKKALAASTGFLYLVAVYGTTGARRDVGGRWGKTIGKELAAFGIDLCFAPVLDRDTGRSQVIGDRAFSGDTAAIVALARAFSRGLAAAGLAATGKHFPGHGQVAADSHHELPVDRRGFAEIAKSDLVPFAELGNELPSLMLAHVRYSAVDPTPASLSRHWIQDVLRSRLGYDGALFCDDLSMGGAAVAGGPLERARLALAAGCDMLLVCNDRPGLLKVLAGLQPGERAAADRRLRALYRRRARAA
jgi:beta-glucosidase-like glycosyl hydrolase